MSARVRVRALAAAAVWLAAVAFPAPSQIPPRLSAAKVRAIEQVVAAEMERQKIPGVSVAVADDLQIAWAGGFGYADLENEFRVKPATVFRLGSISKPITAVAVMQLAERGRLDLDAPVQKYVPSFPEKEWALTARLLLGHLGGIRHYGNLAEVGSTRHYTDLLEPLKIFQDDPLLYEPGARFSYTTYGYNLLGAMVESVAGVRFPDYLRENVFRPAGVERIRPDDIHAVIPNRARGYRRSQAGAIENCGLADTSNKIPGGGMVASADDLLRFATALQRGRLLKPETVQQMFTAQKTRAGQPTNYGLGWFVRERDGLKWVEHGGAQQGCSTDLLLLPSRGVAVSVLTNLERAEANVIAARIAAVMLE